jgi:hypothetical protein
MPPPHQPAEFPLIIQPVTVDELEVNRMPPPPTPAEFPTILQFVTFIIEFCPAYKPPPYPAICKIAPVAELPRIMQSAIVADALSQQPTPPPDLVAEFPVIVQLARLREPPDTA